MQATVKFGQGGDGGRSTTGSFPTLNPTLPFPGILQGHTPPRSTRLWGLFLSPEPCSRSLACPVLGGRGETLILHPLSSSALSSKIRVGPVSFFSFQLHPSLLSSAARFRCCPSPSSPSGPSPLSSSSTPSLLYRPQRSLVAFVCLFLGNPLRYRTKQTPPRIARPLFPSWSFAWRSRPSCPTDIKRRFVATTLLSPVILFPICDIARWEPLDIN